MDSRFENVLPEVLKAKAQDYLDDSTLVNIWNWYCSYQNMDDYVYNNDDDFFETYFEGRPGEAVRAVLFGHYNYNDDWVWFNGYANLDSSSTLPDIVDIDEVIGWIVREENYDEALDYFEISDIEETAEELGFEVPADDGDEYLD